MFLFRLHNLYFFNFPLKRLPISSHKPADPIGYCTATLCPVVYKRWIKWHQRPPESSLENKLKFLPHSIFNFIGGGGQSTGAGRSTRSPALSKRTI